MPKHQEMQNAKNKGASSTALLHVAEVKEGTIVLKDGSLRAAIVVSSTNFSLKSAEEQNALIAAYQSFLNSLNFPIQILMQSRKLDVHSYLDKLGNLMQQQTNELLRLQTAEYIEYVRKLIEFASIMNKTFFVIVPLSAFASKQGLLQKFSNLLSPAGTISLHKQEFDKRREELMQRVNQITGALGGMGLRTLVLDTEELVELLYNSYNLEAASSIRIKNIEELELAREEQT